MEVVVTTGAIGRTKLQSNHHHQQTNIQFFLQAGCPSCRPTNSVKALKGKYHILWTCLPQAHLGLPTLSLTTNSSWLPWGRVSMPLISPLMTVPHVKFSRFRKTLSSQSLALVLLTTQPEWKKRSEATQTVRAGCSKAEQNFFAPSQTPFPGRATAKFNQLEMVTTFTYRPSLVKIDAHNFELSW